MPCNFPKPAYYDFESKRLVFLDPRGDNLTPNMHLPCRKCMGCYIDKSREWSQRIVHESQTHSENCFITLTYDDEHLPEELIPSHLTNFIKRLRHRIGKARYYACGEYGDQTGRPHYHLALFGWEPPASDRNRGFSTDVSYSSGIVESCWHYGHNVVGDLNPASARYIAGYVTKKVSAFNALHVNDDGVVLHPPFQRMSTRPGLGYQFYSKYGETQILQNFSITDAQRLPVQPYYKRKYREENGIAALPALASAEYENMALSELRSEDKTESRRLVRERLLIKNAKLKEKKL